MEEDLIRKAELALGGGVRLPEGYVLPFRISRSTAGPGAGLGAAVLAFGRYRVKKPVSYSAGEFELVVDGDRLSLTRGGEPFLDEVRFEPVVRHSPDQAFFNLDPRCMFHCAYCSSPLLDPSEDKHLSTERIMEMLEESASQHGFGCISFTSGVVGSIQQTVDRIADAVRAAKARFPDVPVGVEPYVSTREQILQLKDAGAEEIKINVESPSREVFGRVCPDLDYDGIWEMLEAAVGIFGRGKVASNMIFGMGETDEQMERAMDRLCAMGAVPGIRALRTNRINLGSIGGILEGVDRATPERAVRLAMKQKECMERHGFDSMPLRTMCMGCGCCDLVPFVDFRSFRLRGSWTGPRPGARTTCICHPRWAPRIRRASGSTGGAPCRASGGACRTRTGC